MNSLEDIQYGNYVHPNNNSRYSRLKIRDHIRQAQIERKGSELLVDRMGKGLHKLFNAVLN